MTPELRRTAGQGIPWGPSATNPFHAMAHPVRRYLVDLLAQCEAPSGELAEMAQHHFGVGWPTVSHHLRVLQKADFARVRWNEPNRIYRLDDRALTRLEDAVTDLRSKWENRTGDGYWLPFAFEEAEAPSKRPRRASPEDDDQAIRAILRAEGLDRDTAEW